MKNTIITIIVAIVVSFVTLVGVYTLVPISFLEKFDFGDRRFGTVGTTALQDSDQLSDFVAFYNTNLNLINNGKVDIASTTWPQLTTAAGLTSAGTIATGVWEATDVGVAHGGTGVSTLTQYGLLFGSSTNAIFSGVAIGTSGQTLVSNGAGELPSFQNQSFTTSDNYTTTGSWNQITGAIRIQNFHASGTPSNPFTLNGTALNFGGFTSASNSVWAYDGSARMSLVSADSLGTHSRLLKRATTTIGPINTTTETSIASTTVPANSLSGNAVRIKLFVSDFDIGGSNPNLTLRFKYGATTLITDTTTGAAITNAKGLLEFVLVGDDENDQTGSFNIFLTPEGIASTNITMGAQDLGVATIDSTADQTVEVTAQFSGNNSGSFRVQTRTIELLN